MYTYVLAVALVMDPTAYLDEQFGPPQESPIISKYLMSSIADWGVEQEILDPREVRYVMSLHNDFQNDLQMLRRRYSGLKDAPFVSDSQRWPDRTTCNEMLSFNRSYRQNLDAQRSMCTPQNFCHYSQSVSETDCLYRIWDTVRDARCEYYYVTVRREALLRLRELLGDDCYYWGALPPPVPLWRFRE